MTQRLAFRFAFFGTLAAIVPLVVYGVMSMQTLRMGTHRSVVEGTEKVAQRTAEQLDQWFTRTTDTLLAVSAELQGTRLERWQQERVLRNYVLTFPEIRSLTLFDRRGVAWCRADCRSTGSPCRPWAAPMRAASASHRSTSTTPCCHARR